MEGMIAAIQNAVKDIEKDGYPDAIKKLDAIIETKDVVSQSLVQRGRCHWEMRNWDTALPDFELALKMEPDNPDIRWTCALIHLQMGNFDKGWSLIDSRWDSERFDSAILKTHVPEWEPDKGYKAVLVWSEQGVGDQILYCSMLKELKKHVEEMLVMVDARLIPMLQRANPDINFCPQNVRVKGIDSHIPMGSLGNHFIKAKHDIASATSFRYMKPDPDRAKELREKLNIKDGDVVIGLSWESAAPKIGEHKSVELTMFNELFSIPGVRVINLNYTNSFKQIYDYEKASGNRIESVPSVDNRNDLEGLTALIDCCGVVISVSNATAHLAGAIGVQTMLLDGNKLWYWSHTTPAGTSLWYPSVQCYPRDGVLASWRPQVDRVVSAVKQMALSPPTEDERPTFVFFHVGDNIKFPNMLCKSIRDVMPDAEIIMCSDKDTPIVTGVDNRFELPMVDRDRLMTSRLQAFSRLGLNKPAMYLDTDIVFKQAVNPAKLLGNKRVMFCERTFNNMALFNPFQRGLEFPEYANMTMEEVYPILACVTITENYVPWSTMANTLEWELDDKFEYWYGDQEAMKRYRDSHRGDCGYLPEWKYACLPEHMKPFRDEDIIAIHFKGDRKELT
jgi:hypothetical protein